MADIELMKLLSMSSPSKIVLLILDGLGGLPRPETGKTELETARTPNLDSLAVKGICGLVDPVGQGITPGSAPGHAALFGYDPLHSEIGRGVLEAVGIDFDLQSGDIAARGNFCTVDGEGKITNRRAGRISTKRCTELCRLLDGMIINNVTILVRPVREHRFVAVFRGAGLVERVSESDPQQLGVTPLAIEALSPAAAKMASVANWFVDRARKALETHYPANMILLRGFSKRPQFQTMNEIYKLTPASITVYPMYRGLARLVGMEALETGITFEDELKTLRENYDRFDFFFVHVKAIDSAGEDGDFDRKVGVIEEVDRALPALIDLNPDVVVVTGDHSTPALLKGHSWHPVPLLISSPWCRPDGVTGFSESACIHGGLGRFPATEIMPLAMAHALKLNKFGA
ncbi:MAG TPA: 2,3-bisphosphoglycerate-independent phosphoglycerate mutase [Dehalococcoidia bacterium]|nr:2,3-bisphosphoglycerate-independent phosphoglycerate mutase [Dehalococcoidia bacterium]